MRREKLKLVTGQPLVFELEDLGVEKTSQIYDGVDYKYSVFHKGASYDLYLKVDAHLAVKRSGAQIGDEIELSKKMVDGSPVYSVRRFSDAHLAMDNTPSVRPAQPIPAANPPGVRMMAPQSQVAPQPASVAHMPAVRVEGANTSLAKRCFRAAIDVLVDTRNYGAQYEVALNFNEEDVRALGITFLIGEQKGGR